MKPENEYSNSSGWQAHPGTHCGHYFRAGEVKSLCNRIVRHDGATEADCTVKCTICRERVNEAFTPSLLGEVA